MSDQQEYQPHLPEDKNHSARLEKAQQATVIAIEVPHAQTLQVKQQVQDTLNTAIGDPTNSITLNDRGEAHLSLIQFKRTGHPIMSELTEEDLEIIDTLNGQEIQILGIGTIPPGTPSEVSQSLAADSKASLAVFLVVDLPPHIKAWQQQFADRYNANKPDLANHLRPEQPHITIGFTQRDRFDMPKTVNLQIDQSPTQQFNDRKIKYGDVIAQLPKLDEQGNKIVNNNFTVMEYQTL